MAGRNGFTVERAAKITRVPKRSVTFWAGPAKVFVPEIARGGRGRGNPKLFSTSDLVRIRVIYLLTQRWIPLRTIKKLMAKRIWSFPGVFDPDVVNNNRVDVLVCRGPEDWTLRYGFTQPSGIPTGMLQGLYADIKANPDLVVVSLTMVKQQIRKAMEVRVRGGAAVDDVL